MSKKISTRSTRSTRSRAERIAATRERNRAADQATSGSAADGANYVSFPSAITIPIPTITFVRYANLGYQHVNNGAHNGHLTLDQANQAQRTAEALEATGAVQVVVIDLSHLTV